MAFGTIAVTQLPVEQYPDIAPPQVNITANYTGASAQTVEDSVTGDRTADQGHRPPAVFFLHQFVFGTGADHGHLRPERQPRYRPVQVQNSVNQAINRLPQEVQQQGVTVAKSQGDSLMVVSLYDTSRRMEQVDVSDFWSATCRIRSAALPASARSMYSVRPMRCGCGWIRTSCVPTT